MELKRNIVLYASYALFCLNCTVMELKLMYSNASLLIVSGLNCTVMELKLRNTCRTWFRYKVLIVPLWN